jgi:gliding motility-associated peptidyl-prolyl isomerase
MRLVKSLFFIVILLSVGCNNPQPRPAINKKAKTDYSLNINQNKLLYKLQDKAFRQYIKENPEKHFKSSQNGFWYAILEDNPKAKNYPKTGDTVLFNYEILDIENNIIYSKKEVGAQKYKVDKQEIISGLQQGIKLMKEGEVAIFLIPSFKAFGVLGDRNKIKTNQPLIYTVYLKKIITHKNNKK